MQKSKDYSVKFGPRVLRKAIEALRRLSTDGKDDLGEISTTIDSERWAFDNLDEFFNSYTSDKAKTAVLNIWWSGTKQHIHLLMQGGTTYIVVRGTSRAEIESVFSIFEEAPQEDITPLKEQDKGVTIFIGHGRNIQWEKLKAHLQDKHELEVISYETGARAGHTIRDILDSMSKRSSFALLVLTGEDKTEEGLRARQNVIHECGLFQGRLGFDRAILIVEDGVQLASNFDGIQQLRFKRGRISEIFGDVIATIRREFGPI
jgi:predicted nucleotide-binding protein